MWQIYKWDNKKEEKFIVCRNIIGLGGYCHKWNKPGSEDISLLIDMKYFQSEKQGLRDSDQKLKRGSYVDVLVKGTKIKLDNRTKDKCLKLQSFNSNMGSDAFQNGMWNKVFQVEESSRSCIFKSSSMWRHSHEHGWNLGEMLAFPPWSIKKMTVVWPGNSEAIASCFPMLWLRIVK